METIDLEKLKKEIFRITGNCGEGTPSEDDIDAEGICFADYEQGFVTCAKAIETRLQALFKRYDLEDECRQLSETTRQINIAEQYKYNR